MRLGLVWTSLACLLFVSGGCASIRPFPVELTNCQQTVFEPVGIIDFRSDTMEDFYAMVRPGDLIINYMRLGRAAKKREWLFALLPYGHSILVIDPHAPKGLLECRFHGAEEIGPEELKLYSYNLIYRLRDSDRLNLERLREFAEHATPTSTGYNFRSWIGRNDNMFPNRPEEISPQYTCSTMVAAAYHYAGVTLSASKPESRVVTPISLAASRGDFNQFALKAGSRQPPNSFEMLSSSTRQKSGCSHMPAL